MSEDFIKWLLMALVIPGMVWIVKEALRFLESQQLRADDSQRLFIAHLTQISDECAKERQAFRELLDVNLRDHTDHSKELYRQFEALRAALDRGP